LPYEYGNKLFLREKIEYEITISNLT